MTTYTYPSNILPSKVVWTLESLTQIFKSPFNNSVQTAARLGARWAATLNYENLEEDEARELIAFLVKLRGRSGRFLLYDHSMDTPRGEAIGVPLVNGASQTGGSLITDGWSNSITGVLLPGDYIGLGNELKMITQSIDSDGSGNATLVFDPPLRDSPVDNSIVTIDKPTARMMLSSDKKPSWSMGTEGLYKLSFSCEEGFTV